MNKPKLPEEATQPVPEARYNMRKRPAKPITESSKRVYRTRDGLVSLRKTPKDLVPIVKSNTQQSPLLRLPAELRNKIFRHGGTREWRHLNSDNDVFRSTPANIALPRVCRQIYSETATLVYSGNLFSFNNVFELNRFVASRKHAQLEAMTMIMVDISWGAFQSGSEALKMVLKSLGRCKGLKKLYMGELRGLWSTKKEFARVKEAEAAVAKGQAGDIEVIFVSPYTLEPLPWS
ncbi:hypothetical protein J4E80_005806 [Alternaria sp. BMP 0032]|nr:hypothetical protein J4E80_005806 [Alternaria sp. BMP 0032]